MENEKEDALSIRTNDPKSTEVLDDFQKQKEKQFVNLIAKIIVDIAFQRAYEKSN